MKKTSCQLKNCVFFLQFLDLVRNSPFLNASLPWRQGTLFAPTNQAIKEFDGKIDNYTLLYHFCKFEMLKILVACVENL